MQDAAEKLGEDATKYVDNPEAMVKAAKKIASMWMKMAQLIRSEVDILLHCAGIILNSCGT